MIVSGRLTHLCFFLLFFSDIAGCCQHPHDTCRPTHGECSATAPTDDHKDDVRAYYSSPTPCILLVASIVLRRQDISDGGRLRPRNGREAFTSLTVSCVVHVSQVAPYSHAREMTIVGQSDQTTESSACARCPPRSQIR